MKLGLAKRLKVLATGSIQEYVSAFLHGEDLPIFGDHVDTDTALKYSAVFGCCRVLAETFASAPLIMYKKDGKDRIPVTELERPDERALLLHDIMHNIPNEEMSAFNCYEAQAYSLNLGGNAVCEKLVNGRGELVGIYPYPHNMVNIVRNKETGRIEYEIGAGNSKKVLRRDQVLHIPGPSLDGIVGMSPIAYAAGAIRLGLSYEQYGINFYKNSANPSGVFEHPDELGDKAYDRLKKDMTKNYTGLTNTGTPMILEGGMKWQQMTINPIDAQLLESKYFQIEDICRLYRVPQHLVNKLDRSTNNNIEHQSLEFVMYTMLPIYKRYEGCNNAQLLTPKQRSEGYYFEFKIDGLLRADAKSRAEAYATGRLNSWLSVNDIRKMENMSPVEGGDTYIQPLNYINITKADEYYGGNTQAENYKRTLGEIEGILERKS